MKTEKASPADSYEEEGEEEEEISQDAPEEEVEDKGKSGAKDHRTSEAPEEKKGIGIFAREFITGKCISFC